MTFDLQNHPEDRFVLTFSEYTDEMDRCFFSGVRQLIEYGRNVDAKSFLSAMIEAYNEAENDILNYITIAYDINSFSDFKIFIYGVMKGMEINNE